MIGTHTPHAHPSAPEEIKNVFSEFLKKIEGSRSLQHSTAGPAATKSKSAGGSGAPAFAGFWEAPARFHNSVPLEDAEIDAIEVSRVPRAILQPPVGCSSWQFLTVSSRAEARLCTE